MDVEYVGAPTLRKTVTEAVGTIAKDYTRDKVRIVVGTEKYVFDRQLREAMKITGVPDTQGDTNRFIEGQLRILKPIKEKKRKGRKLNSTEGKKLRGAIDQLFTKYSRSSASDAAALYDAREDCVQLDPFLVSMFWLYDGNIRGLEETVRNPGELNLVGCISHELVHHNFGQAQYSQDIQEARRQTNIALKARSEQGRVVQRGQEYFQKWKESDTVREFVDIAESLGLKKPYSVIEVLGLLAGQMARIEGQRSDLDIILGEESIAHNLWAGEDSFTWYLEASDITGPKAKQAMQLFEEMQRSIQQVGLPKTMNVMLGRVNEAYRGNTSLLELA